MPQIANALILADARWGFALIFLNAAPSPGGSGKIKTRLSVLSL
jgi:hypothetical protein